jgi:hypothetical protein
MLVFIDESGCPGFKFTRGSDPVFGIGMVIFEGGDHARATEACIAGVRRRTGHRTEFKFSKSDNSLRDEFFAGVRDYPFSVRALIVHKQVIHSKHLRENDDAFYSYFVKMLMAHDGGALDDASIRIDGSGDREFQRAFNSYLRRELGACKVKDVKMSDSARDPLVQLADMCIGAITRPERPRPDGERWKEMLKPRIADVWHFQ